MAHGIPSWPTAFQATQLLPLSLSPPCRYWMMSYMGPGTKLIKSTIITVGGIDFRLAGVTNQVREIHTEWRV